MRCIECKNSLIDVTKRVYTCVNQECSPDPSNGDAVYWCKDCKKSTDHSHRRGKVRGQAGFPFELQGVDKGLMTAD